MSVGAAGFMVTAQGFTLICISLERTQRVRFPLMRVTKLSAIKKISVIWFLAVLSEFPRGIFCKYDPNMKTLMKCYNVCATVKLCKSERCGDLSDFTWLQTKQIFGTWVPDGIYVTTTYLLTFLLPSFWLARGNKILELCA